MQISCVWKHLRAPERQGNQGGMGYDSYPSKKGMLVCSFDFLTCHKPSNLLHCFQTPRKCPLATTTFQPWKNAHFQVATVPSLHHHLATLWPFPLPPNPLRPPSGHHHHLPTTEMSICACFCGCDCSLAFSASSRPLATALWPLPPPRNPRTEPSCSFLGCDRHLASPLIYCTTRCIIYSSIYDFNI